MTQANKPREYTIDELWESQDFNHGHLFVEHHAYASLQSELVKAKAELEQAKKEIVSLEGEFENNHGTDEFKMLKMTRDLHSIEHERDRLKAELEQARDLLERCRDRLDDSDPSDELFCLVNEALQELPRDKEKKGE